MTIAGAGLDGATAVTFGGVAATTYAVDSAAQITAVVPVGAASGPISVTTPGGEAASAASFTVLFRPTVTLKLGGLKNGSLTLGGSLTAKGAARPLSLAGGKVTLTAQLRKGGMWTTARTAFATISPAGAYSWKYAPAKKGSYRLQATIPASAAHTAAATRWLVFTVK